MKIRKVEAITCLAALIITAASMATPIFADASPEVSAAAYPSLTFVGQAWMNFTGPVPILTATLTSRSPGQVNATAYATLHDSIGQTVAIVAVAVVGVSAGQNVTTRFYLLVPLDVYTVDFFALSSAGTAISPTTNSTLVA